MAKRMGLADSVVEVLVYVRHVSNLPLPSEVPGKEEEESACSLLGMMVMRFCA